MYAMAQAMIDKINEMSEGKEKITFTLSCNYNSPKEDYAVVKRKLTLKEAIGEIKEAMPLYNSIELTSEQTGEVVYTRYIDLDYYKVIGELLDNTNFR